MRSDLAGKNPYTLSGRPSSPECALLPLCKAESGKRVKVACVNGERGLCARMAALGIYPGSRDGDALQRVRSCERRDSEFGRRYFEQDFCNTFHIRSNWQTAF